MESCNILHKLSANILHQLKGSTFNKYINYLLHKLSSVCHTMIRLSHVLNVQTLRTVHFVHFHSLVNYGIIFWGSTSSIHKVFIIQKKILQTMLGISSKVPAENGFSCEMYNNFLMVKLLRPVYQLQNCNLKISVTMLLWCT